MTTLSNKNGFTFTLENGIATLNGHPFTKKIRRSNNYADQICIGDGVHQYNFKVENASQWDEIDAFNSKLNIDKSTASKSTRANASKKNMEIYLSNDAMLDDPYAPTDVAKYRGIMTARQVSVDAYCKEVIDDIKKLEEKLATMRAFHAEAVAYNDETIDAELTKIRENHNKEVRLAKIKSMSRTELLALIGDKLL